MILFVSSQPENQASGAADRVLVMEAAQFRFPEQILPPARTHVSICLPCRLELLSG
jgi:hypothetical protein